MGSRDDDGAEGLGRGSSGPLGLCRSAIVHQGATPSKQRRARAMPFPLGPEKRQRSLSRCLPSLPSFRSTLTIKSKALTIDV